MAVEKMTVKTEEELLDRCKRIEGLTFRQLAADLCIQIPADPIQRKGFTGQLVELALGTTAGNKAIPDFCALGIELKTIPINHLGKPAESTFITSISLLTVHKETWISSQCYSKLKRVLWLPIEADKSIDFPHRRIGRAILWSPSSIEQEGLEADWTELSFMIGSGRLSEIDASMGQYLQVRPKAANGKSLCFGFDESGHKIKTLPRGFYLRTSFTGDILSL